MLQRASVAASNAALSATSALPIRFARLAPSRLPEPVPVIKDDVRQFTLACDLQSLLIEVNDYRLVLLAADKNRRRDRFSNVVPAPWMKLKLVAGGLYFVGLEFLFLSGFTYFLGAWIEFEKTARSILQSPNLHPYMVTEIVRVFRSDGTIDRDDAMTIDLLRKQRNVLVHGDSKVIPEKRHIDRLVAITERLQKLPRQKPPGTP